LKKKTLMIMTTGTSKIHQTIHQPKMILRLKKRICGSKMRTKRKIKKLTTWMKFLPLMSKMLSLKKRKISTSLLEVEIKRKEVF